jgi:hypothetical protein
MTRYELGLGVRNGTVAGTRMVTASGWDGMGWVLAH